MDCQRMGTHRFCLHLAILVFASTVQLVGSAGGAEPQVLRVAVAPFFAPSGNARLEQAAALLPDVLTAELSRQDHFQLVERDKVSVLWNEFHLSNAGLVSADTVSKFGRVLNCDWLIAGSLVTTESRAQVWVKIIDMPTAAVLDLEALPFEPTNISTTVSGIAAFVGKPHSKTRARQFVAVGQFTDMSISSARADWSRRLPALIENYCHASGLGVTEREAISPIFEEYQLGSDGMTSNGTNRVKLLPAFWVVDGGYKWVRDTEDKVSVALRIQKLGEKEQVIRFTKSPGPELESAVREAMQSTLNTTNQLDIAQATFEEGTLHYSRGLQLAGRQVAATPSRYSSDSAVNQTSRSSENSPDSRAATLASFERALLLNPNDLQAKTMLGYGLLSDPDPARRERGKDLLRQVVASNDPNFAERARKHLANANLYASAAGTQPTPGNPTLSAKTQGQTGASSQPAISKGASTNSASVFPKPFYVGGFHEMSAIRVETKQLMFAGGTNLYHVNELGRVERIKLPFTIEHPVRSISMDENYWYLGTDGGGLVQVDKTWSKPPIIFGEKDGLLMPCIQCSMHIGDRLWLGFGFREAGGFGYLDLKTHKFVGTKTEIGLFKPADGRLHDPPDFAVTAIDTYDDKTLWVSTRRGLHQFDIASQRWILDLAAAPNCVTVASNFVAAAMYTGGVMVCSLPDGKWRKIELSANIVENGAFAVCKDEIDPRLIWVGVDGKVLLLDRVSGRVAGACPLVGVRNVRWFWTDRESVWFVGDNAVSGVSLVYVFDRTAFPDLPTSMVQASR